MAYDYLDEFTAAKKQIGEWYNDGKINYKEYLIEGFNNVPAAFIGLFSGENIGKQMVKVADVAEF